MSTPADQDRIRELLVALGTEPAPAAVLERLERVLAAEPVPAVRTVRRRPVMRRALAVVAPLAVVAGVTAAVVIGRQDGAPPRAPNPAPAAAGVSVESAKAADSAAAMSQLAPATPSPVTAAGKAAGTAAATADALAARDAALRSYRAVDRAIRRRSQPVR